MIDNVMLVILIILALLLIGIYYALKPPRNRRGGTYGKDW